MSLARRLADLDGYSFVARGDRALLISPQQVPVVTRLRVVDGLFKPEVGMEEPCNGMPSSLWAYNATAKGKPLLGGGLMLALSVLAGCVALLEVIVTDT